VAVAGIGGGLEVLFHPEARAISVDCTGRGKDKGLEAVDATNGFEELVRALDVQHLGGLSPLASDSSCQVKELFGVCCTSPNGFGVLEVPTDRLSPVFPQSVFTGLAATERCYAVSLGKQVSDERAAYSTARACDEDPG